MRFKELLLIVGTTKNKNRIIPQEKNNLIIRKRIFLNGKKRENNTLTYQLRQDQDGKEKLKNLKTSSQNGTGHFVWSNFKCEQSQSSHPLTRGHKVFLSFSSQTRIDGTFLFLDVLFLFMI